MPHQRILAPVCVCCVPIRRRPGTNSFDTAPFELPNIPLFFYQPNHALSSPIRLPLSFRTLVEFVATAPSSVATCDLANAVDCINNHQINFMMYKIRPLFDFCQHNEQTIDDKSLLSHWLISFFFINRSIVDFLLFHFFSSVWFDFPMSFSQTVMEYLMRLQLDE